MRHSEGIFSGSGQLALYYQRWLPAQQPKATLAHEQVVADLAQWLEEHM